MTISEELKQRKSKAITLDLLIDKAQREYAADMIAALTEEMHIPLPSEWAEANRYIPPGVSDYYGPFDPMMTPHLIQPLNDLHPDSPYTHVTNIKSVQSANTTTLAENILGFYIRYKLGSTLFLTSTKNMAGIRGSSNIDVMIDNSNLAPYLKPASNRTGRKTKDNTLYKEFSGGIKLLMSSYKSIADLKSNTFHLIIEDELDEAGTELKDQGDIEGIIEGRTLGVANYKILQISTSSRAETSRIYRNFLLGDQNEYFLPCPECGEKQMLILKGGGKEYGLTFTREKDKITGKKILVPESVRYTCRHCGKDFYETKKQWMLENGVWIPQAVPSDRKRRSYHSPGLISPFLGWERICQAFIDCDFGQDLLKFKDFTINVLGNPWDAVKKAMPWQELRDRADDYVMGSVPGGEVVKNDMGLYYNGPLVLFGGVDVQGDRLELQVVGFGYGMEGWCVDFKVFHGKPGNPGDHCWLALDDWVRSHMYSVCGHKVGIILTAIDSGYDPRKAQREHDFTGKANIVYDFVAENDDKYIAIMGQGDDKGISVLQEARINDPTCRLKKRYNVYVSLVKEMIMNRIDLSEGRGAIHMPKWIEGQGGKKELTPDEHFRRFLSERYQELPGKPGVFGWKKIYKRNEQWDTWIYAYAAACFHNVPDWSQEAWYRAYKGLVDD